MSENPEVERAQLREMLKSQELPGRGFEVENLPGVRSQEENERGFPKTESIRDPNQEIIREGKKEQALLWQKRWDYHREKGADDQWQDTERVKAITEIEREYSDNGQTELERGRHQMKEHDWETLRNHDERGTLTKEEGKVTAGEKKGEHWEVSIERSQVGPYTEVVQTNAGERMVAVDGQPKLESYRTVKVNYRDADNKAVYGWQEMAGDPKSHMEWGAPLTDVETKKPADFFKETKREAGQ